MSAITQAIENEIGEVCDGYVVMDIYPGYTEPGYDSEDLVVAGNWNPKRFPREGEAPLTDEENVGPRLADALEALGADLVWYDEWTGCSECGLALRTQPDSYSWTMYGAFVECDYVCASCMEEDVEAYLEDYINDTDRAVTWCSKETLSAAGWTQWEPNDPHIYESGWHPHQTDDPKKVLASIQKDDSYADVVFFVDGVGQFDIHWSAWTKTDDNEGTES